MFVSKKVFFNKFVKYFRVSLTWMEQNVVIHFWIDFVRLTIENLPWTDTLAYYGIVSDEEKSFMRL